MLPLEPTPYSKEYEITDAMFGAFRTSGGMPFFWKLFGWLTLAYTLLFALFLPSVFKSYFELIFMSVEMGENPTSEQAQMMLSLLAMFTAKTLIMSLFSFAIIAISRAAFFRGYFFGETEGLFPFRFGGDELRQGLAILGYWGVYLIAYLVPYILLIILFVIIFAISGSEGTAGGAAALSIILGLLSGIAMLVFLVWVMVTFAPAGALTALRGSTHVLAARHVSKNRFWALFGAVLVAGLIGSVVAYIFMALGVAVGLAGLFNSDMMSAFMAEEFDLIVESAAAATKSASFKIGMVFAILMGSAGTAFYSLLIAGPQAYFTWQWAESGAVVYAESSQ